MKRKNISSSNRASNLLSREVKLAFSDDAADTLTARIRVTGISEGLRTRLTVLQVDLPALAASAEAEEEVDLTSARDVLAEVIAELVVTWDLEDEDGTPIPATAEGLTDFDFLEVLVISMALLEEVQAAPLGRTKSSKPSTKPASTRRRS